MVLPLTRQFDCSLRGGGFLVLKTMAAYKNMRLRNNTNALVMVSVFQTEILQFFECVLVNTEALPHSVRLSRISRYDTLLERGCPRIVEVRYWLTLC